MLTIGIDIGGTKINFVLLNGKKIVKHWKILTPKTKKALFETLKQNIPQGVKKIGIGVPGPLNKKGDLVLNPPNLRALNNCPLAKIIEKKTGIRTRMDNDARCFAFGEALIGAGRGARTVFGITLGTGVGGGIIIDGKIHRGAFGSAGEVGASTINFDGPKGAVGIPGCLEEYCSGRFFFRKGDSPQNFFKEAKTGDKKALQIFREYGRYLGIGLANVINIFNPETIVIGGGISNAYKFFIGEAKKEMKKRVISPVSKKYVKIKKAALKDLGGALGAALL